MKKIIIIILIALMIGGTLTFIIFKNNNPFSSKKSIETYAKAFQIGAYNNEGNAKKVAVRNNGIVVLENNIYRVYVAIVKDDESVNKIIKYFNNLGLSYYIRDISIKEETYEKSKIYEELINKSNPDTYNTILKDILNIYEGVL